MGFVIVHELHGCFDVDGAACAGRMRVRCGLRLSAGEAEALVRDLASAAGVHVASAGRSAGSVLFFYEDASCRLAALRRLACAGRALERSRQESLARARNSGSSGPGSPASAAFTALVRYFLLKPFVPRWLAAVNAVRHACPFVAKGFRDLQEGRGWAGVLDAAALIFCLAMGAFGAARTLGILFGMAERLERWTRQNPLEPLRRGLLPEDSAVWVREPSGKHVSRRLGEVVPGEVLVVRAGCAIPCDGTVVDGEGVVDRSALFGTPAGVHTLPGHEVYAGCAVADGTLYVRAAALGSATRLSRIGSAAALPALAGDAPGGRFRRLACPFVVCLAGLVWMCTRSLASALTVLAVNLACVRRLSGPMAGLAALREAAEHGVAVRTGGCFEKLGDIDTVVFDKTGTLTASAPSLAEIVPAPGFDRARLLRDMACLEEHFPHPVARAVVKAASELGLEHPEEHGEVQYIVAHGVLSLMHGEEIVVGSRHFVETDEGVDLSALEEAAERQTALGRQLVFVAVGGRAAGMIAMEDPPRQEAREVIQALRRAGVGRILMITGDDERTARRMAERLGIGEWRAEVPPEEKGAIVAELVREGRHVLMVGDGINDAPALAASHVGVAMQDGAALAQGAAGVVLSNGSLRGLITAKLLGGRVLERVRRSIFALMLLNSAIAAGGAGGLLSPALAGFLHSLGTLVLSLRSLGRNLKDSDVMYALESQRFKEAGRSGLAASSLRQA